MNLEQSEIALAVFGRANLAGNRIAGTKIEAANLARGDVNVVWACEIRGICRTQKPEAVLEYLEHAVTRDIFSVFRVLLQDREDDVLLARTGDVFESHIVGGLNEVCDGLLLEFG